MLAVLPPCSHSPFITSVMGRSKASLSPVPSDAGLVLSLLCFSGTSCGWGGSSLGLRNSSAQNQMTVIFSCLFCIFQGHRADFSTSTGESLASNPHLAGREMGSGCKKSWSTGNVSFCLSGWAALPLPRVSNSFWASLPGSAGWIHGEKGLLGQLERNERLQLR